jgi:hypothetical protein
MKKRCTKPGGIPFMERLEGRTLLSGETREVTGAVFHDLNGNFVPDLAETTFDNLTVFDDVNDNGIFDIDEPSAITNANGAYTLMTDAQVFRLKVTPPANWVLKVQVMTDPDVRNFPIAPAPSLSGRAVEDHDLDRVGDTDDGGVAGMVVFVDRDGDNQLDEGEETTTTDEEGNYLFQHIAPGFVRVRLALTSGWSQVMPRVVPQSSGVTFINDDAVTLLPDQTFSRDVFIYRSKTVSGVVFHDADRDGIRDAGESGLGAIRVYAAFGEVYGQNSRVYTRPIDSNPRQIEFTTDADGTYMLPGVPLADSRIAVVTSEFMITTGMEYEGEQLNIGLAVPPNQIFGQVFQDLNKNGQRDNNEPTVAGALVMVIDQEGHVIRTMRSAFNGDYLFSDLPTTTLKIWATSAEDLLLDSNQVSLTLGEREIKGFPLPVSLVSRVTGSVMVIRGNDMPARLAGVRVYLDQNRNGRRDANEAHNVTGGSGEYFIDGSSVGAYDLRIEQVPNHMRLKSGLSSGVAVLGQINHHANFLLEAPIFKARAIVFADVNRNRQLDRSDLRLGNIRVVFDRNDNGKRDADEKVYHTDSAGRFSAFVPYGTSLLKLLVPRGLGRLGIFSQDWTIRVLSQKAAGRLLIPLRVGKP